MVVGSPTYCGARRSHTNRLGITCCKRVCVPVPYSVLLAVLFKGCSGHENEARRRDGLHYQRCISLPTMVHLRSGSSPVIPTFFPIPVDALFTCDAYCYRALYLVSHNVVKFFCRALGAVYPVGVEVGYTRELHHISVRVVAILPV